MVIVKKVEKEELPKWLPEGWSMELRPRIRGEHFPKPNGGTYQCYIAPITNFKFYSKPEVFRYLQSSRNRRAAGSSNKTTTNGNTNKPFEVKKEELPDWLPEGWSMEIRPRMRGECFPKPEGGTYACYIAPVTKFKFYSKPEVFRYLQSSGDRRTRSSNKTTNGNTNKSTTKPAELPAMRRSKKSIRRRAHENQAKDSKLKLHTGGEVDKVPDCEEKKIGYTKATIRRTIALQEQNRLHKRIKAGYFPGKDRIQGDFTSAETDVPDAVSGNITTDGEKDGSKQLTSDNVDQLMENEMDTAAYEGPVNKLSNSIVANSKSLKCMQSVHYIHKNDAS
ncbi:hypothetical protein LIER_30911 [Lithospermum erythrorhizon]|uniref:MBD domain-containing protein n=1 Tax=Lithospermum erythrorhizon TaxID=34254 RepID=A0AAV3RSM7_LITER